MVLPFNEPDEGIPGIEIVRDAATGRFRGFRDLETGRFIARSEAMPRLLFNPETSDLEDTFGNHVGVGAMKLPRAGVEVAYTVRTASYRPLDDNPADYTPRANQELIERVVFVNRDGRLVTMETSYGFGGKYNPRTTGGRWRAAAAEALGVAEGDRLPSADLQRAVILKEFIVKTID